MIAVSFDNCLGILHEGEGDIGVVMCSAQGFEELCGRKDWRLLAQGIADLGLPVLRFDYAGVGDSLGGDLDPLRLKAWRSSLISAISFMRKYTGVRRIALVGLRLGGALATEVAMEDDEVEALIALHPVVSGKAYVRELRIMSKVIARVEGALPPIDGIEVAGFAVTNETMAALNSIDLTTAAHAPSSKVFLCVPQGTANAEALAECWTVMGCDVTCADFQHYAEWMGDPTMSRRPVEAMASTLDWIARNIAPLSKSRAIGILPPPEARLVHNDFVEEPIMFGPDRRLFGVLCRPTNPRPGASTIVFTNAGRNYHIGWARMFVPMARELARLGHASMRIDVGGIGDSPDVESRDPQVMYCMEPIEDLSAAIDALADRRLGKVCVVGLCSGAHLAFHTALQDHRIAQLVMINLQSFIWKKGHSLEVAMRQSYRSTNFYRKNLFQFGAWRRILRGEVRILGIGRELLLRNVRSGLAWASAKFGSEEPESIEVRAGMDRLSRRGVKTLLVYSEGDGGIDELMRHFGKSLKMLTKYPSIRPEYLAGADHNLTPSAVRDNAMSLIADFVKADGLAGNLVECDAGTDCRESAAAA